MTLSSHGPAREPHERRSRVAGRTLSVEASFERLYQNYAPVVIGWLAVRVESSAVEDLFQDVWTVFYQRWRIWLRDHFVPLHKKGI